VVILEYIFKQQLVADLCSRTDLLSYDGLEDIFMPARLHMDGAEVFGVREYYHRGNVDRGNLPSHAWNEIPVLFLAMSCQSIIDDLERTERCNLVLYDTAFDLRARGLWITATYGLAGSDEGHALFAEFKEALANFSHQVRQDFLGVCPLLCDHSTYGSWFRGTNTDSQAHP